MLLISCVGAVGLDLAESCCPRVDSTICLEMANEVETLTDSASPQHCQEACRDNHECTFFTWQTEICFLFRECREEDIGECDSCVSGPFTPPLSSCDGDSTTSTTIHPTTATTTTEKETTTTETTSTATTTTEQETTVTTAPAAKDTVSVAIGGIGYGLLESMEVITPSKVCSGFPDVPSTKYGAAAVFLPGGGQLPGYEAILMCGGYDNYNNLAECHAYNLRDQTWSEWPSLKQARSVFVVSLSSKL